MKKLVIGTAFALFSASAFSGYSANIGGVTIKQVKIYNDFRVYFRLSTMPSDHNCPNSDYFILAPDLSDREHDRYYSMLLTAYASKATVQVGYDNETQGGYCSNSRPIAYSLQVY